jgi:protein-arginine kinase activator protein McsA
VDSATKIPGISAFVGSFVRPKAEETVCPHCKTTAAAVLETGLAGCPLCFEAFPEAWKPFLMGPCREQDLV